MSATKIRIFIEAGGWMATDNSAETLELFGTNTLPLPFLADTPAKSVVGVLEQLNPGASIEVMGGAS